MSGKGSAPRPYSVDPETFSSNWDAIFGKKQEPVQQSNPEQPSTNQSPGEPK